MGVWLIHSFILAFIHSFIHYVIDLSPVADLTHTADGPASARRPGLHVLSRSAVRQGEGQPGKQVSRNGRERARDKQRKNPETARKRLKNGPGGPPKWAPRAPETPTWPERGPRRPQDRPRSGQDEAKTGSRGAQERPRGAQEGPGRAPEAFAKGFERRSCRARRANAKISVSPRREHDFRGAARRVSGPKRGQNQASRRENRSGRRISSRSGPTWGPTARNPAQDGRPGPGRGVGPNRKPDPPKGPDRFSRPDMC